MSTYPLTRYQRALAQAETAKRAQWDTYQPLRLEQLYDDLDTLNAALLNPMANHTSKRATKGGVLYGVSDVVLRPTEHLAIAHALKLYKFESEDPVQRQDPHRQVWYCIACKTFKAHGEFDRDKRNIHGRAFACKKCRKDAARFVWHKSVA